jgi:hypothetical protein
MVFILKIHLEIYFPSGGSGVELYGLFIVQDMEGFPEELHADALPLTVGIDEEHADPAESFLIAQGSHRACYLISFYGDTAVVGA